MVLLEAIGLADISEDITGIVTFAGVAIFAALLLSGRGETVGESFRSGLTGVGAGSGAFLGNVGEGFGVFGTGFGTGFSAITSAIGGSFRGIFDFGKTLIPFSSLHQRNMMSTYNMRTIQLLREGRVQ